MSTTSRTFRKTSGWTKRSPRDADVLRMQCAAAVRSAVRSRQDTATKLGRAVDAVDRACSGDPSSPVYRFLVFQRAVQRPFRLAVLSRVDAERSHIQDEDTDELVRRWREITDNEEHDRERDQNRATYTADDDEAAEADESHAAVLIERAAIRRELKRRGVDVRKSNMKEGA